MTYNKVCFYTVHLYGEELCETDKFIQRFQNHVKLKKDLQEIKRVLEKMGQNGAWSERFRPEDNGHALPSPGMRSGLRLYCFRCTNNTVVLVGGGEKTSDKVKDSPDAYPHFQLMKKIEDYFTERVQEGGITYNGNFLVGDLDFDTENLE